MQAAASIASSSKLGTSDGEEGVVQLPYVMQRLVHQMEDLMYKIFEHATVIMVALKGHQAACS